MRMMISALLQGNTPACAGKSRPVAAAVWPAGKYPRVRGEEKRMIDQADSRLEIPPRARGRVSRSCFLSLLIGNTPACAGKSRHLTARDLLTRKYPRVRGEEIGGDVAKTNSTEIPPRARGRVLLTGGRLKRIGNTPACAGKRKPRDLSGGGGWKYPRVRGEEKAPRPVRWRGLEIPPRARGRVSVSGIDRCVAGNTPACAGKSQDLPFFGRVGWKYPRVRGEEPIVQPALPRTPEIPPRARGRARNIPSGLTSVGNTPACAGKSPFPPVTAFGLRKYPRVRGEEGHGRGRLFPATEIPPRARGRVFVETEWTPALGNTPACAGKRKALHSTAPWTRKYPRVRGEEPSLPQW